MYKRNKPAERNVDHDKTGDQGNMRRTGEGVNDLRKANEEIRKSRGEDSGRRPAIDRDR